MPKAFLDKRIIIITFKLNKPLEKSYPQTIKTSQPNIKFNPIPNRDLPRYHKIYDKDRVDMENVPTIACIG